MKKQCGYYVYSMACLEAFPCCKATALLVTKKDWNLPFLPGESLLAFIMTEVRVLLEP